LPYFCTVKATDSGFLTENKLVSFMTFQIRVVPPAITGLTATPLNNALKLNWNATNCSPSANPLIAYHVYRSNTCDAVVFDPCQSTLPSTSGYTLIGNVGASVTSFLDNNNGDGLAVGQNYSYLVVAEYEDGLQSFAGLPYCTELRKNIPLLTNVDVTATGTSAGAIDIKWLPPLTTPGNLDLNVFKGPYRYVLRHRTSADQNYTEIANFTKSNLLDLPLSFSHLNITTDTLSHDYILDFFSDTILIGSTLKSTSIFLKAAPDDRKIRLNWSYHSPWTNSKFNVYKRDPGATNFVLLNTVNTSSYIDANAVVNGSSYCYYVQAEGQYSDLTIARPLLNRSQIACATALDKIVPVAPSASISADCPNNYIEVHWSDIKTQSDDVASYQLYYKPSLDANYSLIANFKEADALFFNSDNPTTFGGCYAVKATDINGNIGPLSEDLCIDICPEFELPNVFTPNNDQSNDFFKAIRVKQIKEIDLNIVDRWGNLVYHTTDPYFLWNGLSQITHQPCSEGAFMYVCHVYEPRLRGTVKRTLHGVVQLIR
jgi:gliding motility-associated-like protein